MRLVMGLVNMIIFLTTYVVFGEAAACGLFVGMIVGYVGAAAITIEDRKAARRGVGS